MVRLNQLKHCPFTQEDIKNALTIFGPDLANTRSKTVQRCPDHVDTDYIKLPAEIISHNKVITLVVDVMFVNSVPFLVSMSCNTNLITIEHAPHRTAIKLAHLLQRIITVNTWAGFTLGQ